MLRKLRVFSKLNTSLWGGVVFHIPVFTQYDWHLYKWHRQRTSAWGILRPIVVWIDKIQFSKISFNNMKYCTVVIYHCLFRNKDIFYIHIQKNTHLAFIKFLQRIQNQHQTQFKQFWGKNCYKILQKYFRICSFSFYPFWIY